MTRSRLKNAYLKTRNGKNWGNLKQNLKLTVSLKTLLITLKVTYSIIHICSLQRTNVNNNFNQWKDIFAGVP